jgi:CheY-like chemotaxis protein
MHRVLLVEDDPNVRAGLHAFLRNGGYEVRAAEDGQQALEALRSGFGPCLILLDMVMPVKNGRQFREEQLADPSLRHIPVVILSGLKRDEGEVVRLSVDAWIEKPLRLDALEDALGRLCSALSPPAGRW